jgi:quinol monooxygenase YgiN
MNTEQDYTTSFVVEQTPEEVFAALTNPRAWWSEDIDGTTDKFGALFYYHFKDIHRGTFKVTELVPGKKVTWHVVQNYFNFVKDMTEWTGTDLVFEIAPTDRGTEIRFTHVGLKPSEECYDVCHDSWGFYIGSLRNLISTGSGQPNKGEENANPTVVPQIDPGQRNAGNAAEIIVMTTAAAKPGVEGKVRNALRDVAAAGRRQTGCIEYSVLRSAAEPNVTICVERWTSKAERDAFLRSADVKTFVSAITGAFLATPSPISYTALGAA